ncbi:MAG: DUF615 domain-containing protein [Pseudomonadales bacterium]|nr:DUF615 domain-containing protein [Pseudomonadales bacterium]
MNHDEPTNDMASALFNEEQDQEKSKTRIKNEMLALQKLGENLVALSPQQLQKIPLEGTLLEAITTAQKLKKREALRRQLQYIGKLMRTADFQTIERHWQQTQTGSIEAKKHLHYLETWRDRLISEGERAMEALLEDFPTIDRQHIRQLIRQAQKEAEQQKPLAASRKIFRYLKETHENQ